VTSHLREIHELGNTVNLAQRAIWSFAHFVPKEIVRGLMDNSISTTLGGAKQEITLVFTDVQGFTTIAEAADPDMLMRQTSRYFSVLTQAFLGEGGTVDKFIGDAVMAFWGAPAADPEHALHACRAALALAEGMRAAEARGEPLGELRVRIGLHTGTAIVGNVGSSRRLNYTALGDTVNLASRLEGVNKVYGTTILLSAATAEAAGPAIATREVDTVAVYGRHEACACSSSSGPPAPNPHPSSAAMPNPSSFTAPPASPTPPPSWPA
jgi:adenylate cyclase